MSEYKNVFLIKKYNCVEKIVEARKEEGLSRYIRMRFRIEGS
jgi:hypothetical protein